MLCAQLNVVGSDVFLSSPSSVAFESVYTRAGPPLFHNPKTDFLISQNGYHFVSSQDLVAQLVLSCKLRETKGLGSKGYIASQGKIL